MVKDSSVWRMIGALADQVDFERLQIVDHWDADLFAIGIAHADEPRQLVYLCTFDQQPGRYSYACETPAEQPANVVEQADGVSFDQLVDVIRRHLSASRRVDVAGDTSRWKDVAELLVAFDAVARSGANAIVKIDGGGDGLDVYTVVLSGSRLGKEFFHKEERT